MSDAPRDIFERARMWAATGLVLAAALLVAGSFLDWVSITLPDRIPADQAPRAGAINGFDVTDGYWLVAAAVVLAASAVALLVTARNRFAWIAFLAAVVAGGIAVSDYRGIAEIFQHTDAIGGRVDPGVGLVVVAAGGFLGLVSAVAAIAATPRSG